MKIECSYCNYVYSVTDGNNESDGLFISFRDFEKINIENPSLLDLKMAGGVYCNKCPKCNKITV